MNLPLLTSVLSISCIVAVGRRKWWGHLFGVANCIAFTVIAFRPGQWGYLPSNAICFVLYAVNAWRWRYATAPCGLPLNSKFPCPVRKLIFAVRSSLSQARRSAVAENGQAFLNRN